MSETLRNVARVILLIWFVVVSLFIFIPSYYLLTDARSAEDRARTDIEKIPLPSGVPDVVRNVDPKADPAVLRGQVALYSERATAYAKEVDAYTKYITERTKSINRTGTYTAVVKDVLATMVTGFVTTLLGLIFANLGAQVANNFVLNRQGVAPEKISLF